MTDITKYKKLIEDSKIPPTLPITLELQELIMFTSAIESLQKENDELKQSTEIRVSRLKYALQDIVYQCGQASQEPAIIGILTSANKAIQEGDK
jgi:hypothetical protein